MSLFCFVVVVIVVVVAVTVVVPLFYLPTSFYKLYIGASGEH